jgi:putative DNA primase/helicase
VQLADAGDVLMVGEGIETCLAAMQATGNPVWAALSTSGLRTLDLPVDVRDVIVLADGDDPGEAAARDCAWRWKRDGRRVRIARPAQGMDFNDLLIGHAPGIQEGVQ